jgi:hypothetical protein
MVGSQKVYNQAHFCGFFRVQLLNIYQRLKSLQNPRITSTTGVLLGLSIVSMILGYLIYREKDLLIHHSWQIKAHYLILSLVFYLLAVTGTGVLWSNILRSFNMNSAHVRDHLKIFFLSNLGKRLPGTIWYIAMRAQMYQSIGLSARFVSIVSGTELAVIIASGVVVTSILASPILLTYRQSFWGLLILAMVCILALNPKFLAWAMKKFTSEEINIPYKNIMIWVFAGSGLWLLSGAGFISTIAAFFPLDAGNYLYILGIWSFIGVLAFFLFFLPSNFGFQEVGISLLLLPVLPTSFGVVVVVIHRILTTLADLLIGFLIYLSYRRTLVSK